MLVLDLNEDELIKMIQEGKDLGQGGFSGVLFLANGYLIKMDRSIYRPIKNNNNYGQNLQTIYHYQKTSKFAKEEQITYLCNLQKEIKLTDFDLGVVKIEGVICGVILTNHLDYQNLGDFKVDDYKKIPQLCSLLKNILLALKELEDHQISQIDLINEINCRMNILYKENDIKLCDLEGIYLKYGSMARSDLMYLEYSKLLKHFLKQIKDLGFELPSFFEEEITTYDKALEVLNNFFLFVMKEYKTRLNNNLESISK